MNKTMMTLAIASIGLAAMAQECQKGPKGPEGECKGCRGPKPAMLVLDKDLTPDKVEAYKAEVSAKIDEIVKHHNEMAAKCAEKNPEGECKCKKCERPAPRIMLVVGDGQMNGGPRGPMGMKHGRRGGERGFRHGRGEGRAPEGERPEGDEGEMPPPPPETPAPDAE